MADLPAHEAAVGLLRHWGDARFVPTNVYSLSLGQPNQLLYFLILAFAYVVRVGTASKLVVAATLVLLPVAAARYADHLRVTRWTALVVAPIGLGWLFFLGLLANLLGLVAYLFALPVLDRFVSAPTVRRFALVSAIIVGLHFVHGLMAAAAGVTLIVLTLCAWREWRVNAVRMAPTLLVGGLALFSRALAWQTGGARYGETASAPAPLLYRLHIRARRTFRWRRGGERRPLRDCRRRCRSLRDRAVERERRRTVPPVARASVRAALRDSVRRLLHALPRHAAGSRLDESHLPALPFARVVHPRRGRRRAESNRPAVAMAPNRGERAPSRARADVLAGVRGERPGVPRPRRGHRAHGPRKLVCRARAGAKRRSLVQSRHQQRAHRGEPRRAQPLRLHALSGVARRAATRSALERSLPAPGPPHVPLRARARLEALSLRRVAHDRPWARRAGAARDGTGGANSSS